MVRIRKERPEDVSAIRQVNIQSFGRTMEADIVDKLRRDCKDLLSLVAVKEKEIVGHVAFNPVIVEGEYGTVRGMGLAPMAVLPRCQLQGIGSKLIRTGIARLRSRRCPFVIVLGHPQYYPRFGFEPASHCGIRSEWQVSDEAFMILVLDESEMRGTSGVAKYRPEFAEAMQARESTGLTDTRSVHHPPAV
jgi:putative acetyltransferase